jgi:hypothetical protein
LTMAISIGQHKSACLCSLTRLIIDGWLTFNFHLVIPKIINLQMSYPENFSLTGSLKKFRR